MDQSEAGYRQAAAECLEAARLSFDQTTRAGLVAMAQRYLDLANDHVRHFNAGIRLRGKSVDVRDR